jgi:ribonuclease HI
VLRYGGTDKDISGAEADTTNNRMELMAAIMSLESLKRRCDVDLYTDSTYVRDGIMKWMDGWKAKNWKTANRKPVKNKDLWLLLDEAVSKHNVAFHWVKGHSGHPDNDRADALAVAAIDTL